MKLLLDENLSFRLVRALQPYFPESKHVKELGLSGADDLTIWEYARAHLKLFGFNRETALRTDSLRFLLITELISNP